jgi:hypothetical protein
VNRAVAVPFAPWWVTFLIVPLMSWLPTVAKNDTSLELPTWCLSRRPSILQTFRPIPGVAFPPSPRMLLHRGSPGRLRVVPRARGVTRNDPSLKSW